MSGVTTFLVALAFAFAFVTGANNGGTLVAVQLRATHRAPWLPVVILASIVGLGPAVVGTGVATTVAERLAVFSGPTRDVALATTMLASVVVVLVLSRLGLPTSLFAALIGAIAGAAAGLGLAVEWVNVALVLLAAVLTPWVGALLAWAAMRGQRIVPHRLATRPRLARTQVLSFVALAVAYGANGAQILVALLSLALRWSPQRVAGDALLLGGLAACFAVGSVVGLARLSSSVGSGIVALRPQQAGSAKTASTVAVGAAAALGLPVSTTQVVTAALIGTGAAEGYRRIRWRHAQRIFVGWLLTVPATFVLCIVVGVVVRPAV